MSAEGYSVATYTAIKSGVKPAEALKRLQAILERQGHLALYARILHILETKFQDEERKNRVVVRVAKKSDATKYGKEISTFLKETTLSDEKVVIDESIIGGYVLEGADIRKDASYKSSLLTIYKNLVTG